MYHFFIFIHQSPLLKTEFETQFKLELLLSFTGGKKATGYMIVSVRNPSPDYVAERLITLLTYNAEHTGNVKAHMSCLKKKISLSHLYTHCKLSKTENCDIIMFDPWFVSAKSTA